ncbi:peptidylprolyl isomerase [bacterium]|nr:peptidylprolyl isomerase [bacterium]
MKKVLLVLFLIAISLVGCNKAGDNGTNLNLFPATKSGKVIASFDGLTITDEYVESYLNQLNPYLRNRYSDPEKKKELVDRIVEGELLAYYAMKEGAATDKVLLTKIKSNIARFYMGSVLKNKIEKEIKVTPAEIKEYFKKNTAKYTQPAKVKTSHILVKITDARDEAAAKKLAGKVYGEVMTSKGKAQSFVKLVQKYSDDAGSKRRGGDVGYFATVANGGRMVKEFTEASFALKDIGDISALVKTQYGFHIIKLTGKKEAVVKNINDVEKRIESALKADKRKEAYKTALVDIKKRTNFKIDEAAVQAIKMDIPDEVKNAPKMGEGMKGARPQMNGQGKPQLKLNKDQIKKMQEMRFNKKGQGKGKGMRRMAPAPKAQEK